MAKLVQGIITKDESAAPTLEQLDARRKTHRKTEQAKNSLKPDTFSKFLIIEGWSHWFFRLGFASIFLMNAITAVSDPTTFAAVLEDNVIASKIGYTDNLVSFAIANDIILATFILGGWRKRFVYAWAGLWLLLVAGLKLMNLIFPA